MLALGSFYAGAFYAAYVWVALRDGEKTMYRPAPRAIVQRLAGERRIGFVAPQTIWTFEPGAAAASHDFIMAQYSLVPALVIDPAYGAATDRASKLRTLIRSDAQWREVNAILFRPAPGELTPRIEQVLREEGFRRTIAPEGSYPVGLWER